MAARSPSSADSNSARNDTDGADDKAVEITYDSQDVHLARTVRWKTDLWVLPIASMIYFLSFLDRSNIGNARVAGLQAELAMTNHQYSVALTVTYVPYILIELPSNLLLKKVGPNILLPLMITLWGVVSTLQGLVTTYSGLIACRFFLGLTEGGLLPGLLLYLSTFYPRQQLQLRIAIFFSTASLAGAFSGLLAAAIVKMEGVGGKHGWCWIFILEGLFTVLFGVCCFFIMPATPSKAKFLTAEEKQYIGVVLREDGVIALADQDNSFDWAQVLKVFTQPHVLLLAIAAFFSGTTLYALAYFLPTIVATLGFTANQAQLMSVPPYAVSFVLSLVTSFMSDSYGARGLTIILFSIMGIIGFGMFLGSNDSHVRYGALFLVLPGTYCAAVPLQAWMANNSAPYLRRAAALAFFTTMTNSGGILSTWLVGTLSPAPQYTKASIILIIFQIGMLLCAAVNVAYLQAKNKEKQRTVSHSELGKDAEDGSLGDDSAWYRYKL